MRPMRSCEHSPKPSAYQERPNEHLGRRPLFAVLSDQSVVLSAARTKLSQKQEPDTVVDGGLFRASGHRQPPGCSRPHRAADGDLSLPRLVATFLAISTLLVGFIWEFV